MTEQTVFSGGRTATLRAWPGCLAESGCLIKCGWVGPAGFGWVPRGGAAFSRISIHIRAGRQPFLAAEVSDGEAGGPMGAVIAVPAPYSHNHPLICLFNPSTSRSLHRVWPILPLLHESGCLHGVVFIIVPHQLPTL